MSEVQGESGREAGDHTGHPGMIFLSLSPML